MTIAEESTAWPGVSRPTHLGGLGFGFKWNMGWMHDFLHYMALDPIFRRFHHNNITFSLMYAFQEHFVLVLSHDEVVHGKRSLLNKMPGDEWQQFANLRMFYAWMYGHPGKKLLFMGGEFGQRREWNHDRELDWELDRVAAPRRSAPARPAFEFRLQKRACALGLRRYPRRFRVDRFSRFRQQRRVAFMRRSRDGGTIVFAVNATPMVRHGYRLGVPGAGFYREIINTDAETYGGEQCREHGRLRGRRFPVAGPDAFAHDQPAAAGDGRVQAEEPQPSAR